MAVAAMVAFKAGSCAMCGKRIAKGETFHWGRKMGDKVHPACLFSETPVEPVEELPLSGEQQVIVDAVVKGKGSLVVQARAGTGKTHTIKAACMKLPRTTTARYLVFAKKNATEAKAKLGAFPNVEPSTFHSAGYGAMKRRLGDFQMDDRKVDNILADLVIEGFMSEAENDAFGNEVAKLVHFAKCVGIGAGLKPDIEGSWYEIIEHFGLQFDMPKMDEPPAEGLDVEARAIEIARRALQHNNDDLETLDYDDLLYQTVRLHVPIPKSDIVFVDEAQDTNAVRRAMVHMMVKPNGGRVVAVGDDRQAILGFTGADADSLDLIRKDFQAKVLPLSINRRCSKAVVQVAQEWVPDIQARDDAPEGSVSAPQSWKLTDFTNSDAILCRTNAPLVTLWYKLFRNHIPAQVLGRDLGKGILALVKKLQGRRKSPITIDMLIERAEAYKVREIQKWQAKGDESKAQAAADKVDCLMAAIDTLPETERTLNGLIDHINSFVSAAIDVREGDDTQDLPHVLTLCSVHKSKGLEWDRVYILNWSQMPSKWAKREWEQQQESNLQYVAVTRAKYDLFLIEDIDLKGE